MDAELKEDAERKNRKEKDGGDILRYFALGLQQDMLETTRENKK